MKVVTDAVHDVTEIRLSERSMYDKDEDRRPADGLGIDVDAENCSCQCAVCDNNNVRTIASIAGAPTNCHMICSSPEDALRAPVGNIRLGFCKSCGMISNLDFDPQLIMYERGYDNALHHSPLFRSYAEGLASRLVEQYLIRDNTVIEIGCGDGYFLRQLCELGGNRGWGFDPSCEPKEATDDEVTIVAEYFDASKVPDAIDFVCCRHVLEHISQPRPFVGQLREAMPEGAVVYCEVPDANFTLAHGGIWDILYEHCSYFTDHALAHLFREAGFRVLRTSSAYDGQFLQIEAMAVAAEPSEDIGNQTVPSRRLEQASHFEQSYREAITNWNQRLVDLANTSKRVAIWGAGTKGIMFLNTVAAAESVACVVDINPSKQGRFVVGTGTPIVAPKALTTFAPDVVLLTNPTYAGEVQETLNELKVGAEVLPIS
jgi:SAM-dependent methyltransferase